MTARENYYAQALTETTTTSTTFGDQVALTATLTNAADYWLFYAAEINNSANTTSDAKLRLRDDTAAADLRSVNVEMRDASTVTGDYVSVHGFIKITGTGSTNTWSIEFAAETNTNTIRCRNATLFILKADAADQYAATEGSNTNSTTTYSNDVTLTFTPASTGDYLVIAACEINGNVAGTEKNAQLEYASAIYGLANYSNKDATNFDPWATAVKLNLPNSSQTFNLQFATASGSVETAEIRHANILALRLDVQANSYYAETRTQNSTTSTTYQDQVTLTQTPVAGDHIIFGFGLLNTVSAVDSVHGRVTEAGSSIRAHQHKNAGGASTNRRSLFAFSKETLAASSYTWKTQWATHVSATAKMDESGIAVIELASAGGGGTSGLLPFRTPPMHGGFSQRGAFQG